MNKTLLNVREPAPIISTRTRDIHLDCVTVDDIDFVEAARTLARIPRYGGQSDEPFSVLQHLLLCDSIASYLEFNDPELRLRIILHDVHEYIIGDFPSPLKRLLDEKSGGFIKELERSIDVAVHAAAGLTEEPPEVALISKRIIKQIDHLALFYEVNVVYPSVIPRWDLGPASDKDLLQEVRFLTRTNDELHVEMFNDRILTLTNLVG